MTNLPRLRIASSRVLRHLRMRPRLIASGLVGSTLFVGLHLLFSWRLTTRLLAAWDLAVTLYLLLAWTMMLRSNAERMRLRARHQDDGAGAALALSVVAAVACLAAIVVELATVQSVEASVRSIHVLLSGYTIVAAWAFIHTTFAIHYAYEYYRGGADGPRALEFPGMADPDYLDFLYFAFVIGTSGQTADVSLASRRMRRIGLLHCVLAFIFNTTILALTINIGASLIGAQI